MLSIQRSWNRKLDMITLINSANMWVEEQVVFDLEHLSFLRKLQKAAIMKNFSVPKALQNFKDILLNYIVKIQRYDRI